jgi:hypothetical protein
MITKHLFGLMECYECSGVCYILEKEINPVMIPIIYLGLGFLIIGIMFTLIKLFRKPEA